MEKKGGDAAYLFHDHLEQFNLPVYFQEFFERAAAHGLQYLSDSEAASVLFYDLSPGVRRVLRPLPLVQQEQLADFLANRRFRSTLLCHQDVPLRREIPEAAMKRFHFGLAARYLPAEVDLNNDEPVHFNIGRSGISVSQRLVKAALVCLDEVFPRQVAFADLSPRPGRSWRFRRYA